VTRPADRRDVASVLADEDMASVVTVRWPTWSQSTLGRVAGAPTERQVRAFVDTMFDRRRVGGPQEVEAVVTLAAEDTSGATIPALTDECQVVLPTGQVLQVLEPRPFPGDGDAVLYQPLVGTGQGAATRSRSQL
jgi:hypothetical protein